VQRSIARKGRTRTSEPIRVEILLSITTLRLGFCSGSGALSLLLAILQKWFQAKGSGWVSKLTKRFGLDLAYALAGNIEAVADFLERVLGSVFHSKTHS